MISLSLECMLIKNGLKGIKSVILDLLIVFIGVFAAFQLSAYKEDKGKEESRLNYFRAFRSEVYNVKSEIDNLLVEVDRVIEEVENYQPGESNHKIGYNPKISFVYSKPYIIESAFNSIYFPVLAVVPIYFLSYLIRSMTITPGSKTLLTTKCMTKSSF